jgi:hypothetical protein
MVGRTGTTERDRTSGSRWDTKAGRTTACTLRTCVPARIRPDEYGSGDLTETAADWNVVRGED